MLYQHKSRTDLETFARLCRLVNWQLALLLRPQFFIPIITLLRNAAQSSLKYKTELALVKAQNIDITNFENELEMTHGIPYKYHPDFPTNYVYMVSISSSTGFVPMFESGASDSRFLGVMVRLIPTYGERR